MIDKENQTNNINSITTKPSFWGWLWFLVPWLIIVIVSLLFVVILLCNSVVAEEPFRSFNGDWGVFMGQRDGNKFCYIAAKSYENKDYLVLQYVETGLLRSVLLSEYGFLTFVTSDP